MNPELQLQDPNLPPQQLAEIATNYPQLQGQVLAHPNCYPELAEWIV